MFDNLPFEITDRNSIYSFIESPNLILTNKIERYSQSTGEIRVFKTYKYFNVTITVEHNTQEIPIKLTSRGSFHYLKNVGKHNANNFTHSEFIELLDQFSSMFNVELKDMRVLPFEFGVNIIPLNEANQIVNNTFYERRKKFTSNRGDRPSKISGNTNNDYRIKLYDKNAQFPLDCPQNTLRMELQIKRMRMIKNIQIENIQDLISKKKVRLLNQLFLDNIKHLVIYDYSIVSPKSKKIREEIVKLSNQVNWDNLKINIANNKTYSTEYNQWKRKLELYSEKYGSSLQKKLIETIHSKLEYNVLN